MRVLDDDCEDCGPEFPIKRQHNMRRCPSGHPAQLPEIDLRFYSVNPCPFLPGTAEKMAVLQIRISLELEPNLPGDAMD